MGTVRKPLGRRGRKDEGLPYTYEAWVDITAGEGLEPIFDHYFSKTICGLIECLDEEGIRPDEVRLFGVFRGQQTRLNTDLCSDNEGRWLKRPDLCRALEEHYEHTHEECYRGHVEKGPCAFEDRDRAGSGPVW